MIPGFIKRTLFIAIGLICTGLGILGVWLPGLPTTIFILIALWAFTQSSQRLYQWLYKVPVLSSAIKEIDRFQLEGTISLRVKLISQGCAWISFIVVTVALQNLLVSIIAGGLAVSCSVFMYLVPTTQINHKAIKSTKD